MANATPPAAAPAASTTTAPELSEEQRIAAQRLRDLESQASTAAAETQTARSDAAAAKGDLERSNLELAAARVTIERLSAQLEQLNAASAQGDKLPALPVELPKNAKQLVESVTFAAVGADGNAVRANGRRGDVVVVGKADAVEELQGRIGQLARVYPVTRATADELDQLKHVR